MRRYNRYKDSGVEWIGEVPEGWKVINNKFVATINPPKTVSPHNIVGYAPMECVRNGIIKANEIEVKDLPTGLSYFENGDLVIAKVTPCFEHGNIAIAKELKNGCAYGSSELFVFRCKGVLTQYLFYYVQDENFKQKCCSTMTGTGGLKRVSSDFIRNAPIPFPPFPEQRAIATYLDAKCGKIDHVIATQRRRIELLQELKQSIITRAVTKGLNHHAKMKDSGVEWIEEVPEGWKTLRLRFVCELRNGYTPSKANSDFWENGTIPWYRMEDIRESGRRLKNAKQYITEDAVKGGGLFEAGSFIMATTATIGEHAVLIVDSLANQRFTNLKIRESLSHNILNEFLFNYLFIVDDYCKTTTRTATFPAVNIEDLKNFPICIPSTEEQQQIVDYIRHETNAIDSLISKSEKQITLMQELKQSLITEVVTGKRKVC